MGFCRSILHLWSKQNENGVFRIQITVEDNFSLTSSLIGGNFLTKTVLFVFLIILFHLSFGKTKGETAFVIQRTVNSRQNFKSMNLI